MFLVGRIGTAGHPVWRAPTWRLSRQRFWDQTGKTGFAQPLANYLRSKLLAGAPAAIASAGGRPNPSISEG